MTKANVMVSHIGICTSDLERSTRFYTGALGFELAHSIEEVGPPFDTLMELPGVTCAVRHLKCGETTIELIGYPGHEVTGTAQRRPMDRLGFTHMTLVVEDVGETASRVVEYGGQAHAETRIESHLGPMIFCTDPDGVRIELIQGGL